MNPIRKVCVIGAGVMGAGIAAQAARARSGSNVMPATVRSITLR